MQLKARMMGLLDGQKKV